MGPTLCKIEGGDVNQKAWILLLTCFCTRAIHLEVILSLEAEEFIEAFRRFVARRGIPREVLSDNASQIVLSRQVLVKFAGITWKLTPPLAPWAGGVYERFMSITKSALRRSLGRKVLR